MIYVYIYYIYILYNFCIRTILRQVLDKVLTLKTFKIYASSSKLAEKEKKKRGWGEKSKFSFFFSKKKKNFTSLP